MLMDFIVSVNPNLRVLEPQQVASEDSMWSRPMYPTLPPEYSQFDCFHESCGRLFDTWDAFFDHWAEHKDTCPVPSCHYEPKSRFNFQRHWKRVHVDRLSLPESDLATCKNKCGRVFLIEESSNQREHERACVKCRSRTQRKTRPQGPMPHSMRNDQVRLDASTQADSASRLTVQTNTQLSPGDTSPLGVHKAPNSSDSRLIDIRKHLFHSPLDSQISQSPFSRPFHTATSDIGFVERPGHSTPQEMSCSRKLGTLPWTHALDTPTVQFRESPHDDSQENEAFPAHLNDIYALVKKRRNLHGHTGEGDLFSISPLTQYFLADSEGEDRNRGTSERPSPKRQRVDESPKSSHVSVPPMTLSPTQRTHIDLTVPSENPADDEQIKLFPQAHHMQHLDALEVCHSTGDLVYRTNASIISR